MKPEQSLPVFPGPVYMTELYGTHVYMGDIVHGTFMAESRKALTRVMNMGDLPADLRAPFSKWSDGGKLGEGPNTALALESPRRLPAEDRLRSVCRGAVTMTALAVADSIALEGDVLNRPVGTSMQYYSNVREALLEGARQDPVPDGPPRQQNAYAYARAAGAYLGLRNADWLMDVPVGDYFDNLMDGVRIRLAQGQGCSPQPTTLMEVAKTTGAACLQLGAAMSCGRMPSATTMQTMGHIGAMIGIQEHKRVPTQPGVQTYARAMVEAQREWGMSVGATEMDLVNGRATVELTKLYRQAYDLQDTRRKRGIVRTLGVFVQAYDFWR